MTPPAEARLRPLLPRLGLPRFAMMANARLLRLLIGIGLIAAALWYLYLYTFNKVSIAGVVNAPLITIVAQLDGRVTADNVGQGAALKTGQQLGTVVDNRVDNRTRMDLKGSLEAAKAKLDAVRGNIAELTALKAELERRTAEHRAKWIEHLQQDVAEAEAAVAAAHVTQRQAADALVRGNSLVVRGAVSRAGYDTLAYTEQHAAAELGRAEATLARRSADLAAARAGIMLSDGNWSDVTYSRQRLDEIEIKLAALHNDERVELAAIGEIEAKYRAEETRVERIGRQEITAPVDGVVWRSRIAPGAAVVRGMPLLELIDCGSVYVEATTRERFFESITPGQQVRVRLEGGDRDIAGKIRAIVGPGATLTTNDNVSVIQHRSGTEAQLVVDIERKDLPPSPGSTCNVGRSAKVYFK